MYIFYKHIQVGVHKSFSLAPFFCRGVGVRYIFKEVKNFYPPISTKITVLFNSKHKQLGLLTTSSFFFKRFPTYYFFHFFSPTQNYFTKTQLLFIKINGESK